MLRKLVPVAAVALGLGSALLVASCGGDSNNPSLKRGEAELLLAELEQVQANFDVQSCTVAASHADTFVLAVQELPDSVDSELRRALENGAEQLQILLNDPENCENPPTEPTVTEPTETEPTVTEPTETEPTETEPTVTEPTTPTEPTTTDGSGGTGL